MYQLFKSFNVTIVSLFNCGVIATLCETAFSQEESNINSQFLTDASYAACHDFDQIQYCL
jgi:hypothetical protein